MFQYNEYYWLFRTTPLQRFLQVNKKLGKPSANAFSPCKDWVWFLLTVTGQCGKVSVPTGSAAAVWCLGFFCLTAISFQRCTLQWKPCKWEIASVCRSKILGTAVEGTCLVYEDPWHSRIIWLPCSLLLLESLARFIAAKLSLETFSFTVSYPIPHMWSY